MSDWIYAAHKINWERRNKVPETTGQDILKAIDLANIVRFAGGYPLVHDLVPGEESNPENCVLANTFNCSCKVQGTLEHENIAQIPEGAFSYADSPAKRSPEFQEYYGTDSPWYVWFEEKKYADALAGELNQTVWEYAEPNQENKLFGVSLPSDVGYIASNFDEGALNAKYYLDTEDDRVESW